MPGTSTTAQRRDPAHSLVLARALARLLARLRAQVPASVLVLGLVLVGGCGVPGTSDTPAGRASSSKGTDPGGTGQGDIDQDGIHRGGTDPGDSDQTGTDPGGDADETARAAPDPGYQAPQVGQCHRLSFAQSRASVAAGQRVSCAKPHQAVVAYVGYRPRAVTPGTPVAKRRALGRQVCEPAYRRVVGGTLVDRATSLLTWTLFTPDRAQLARGARWVRCDVLARSGSWLVPLPTAVPMLGAGVPEQLRVCQDAAGLDVSCGGPHAFRVEAAYQETGTAYPTIPAYPAVARTRCLQLTKKYGGYWQPPSITAWQSGDRFIRCLSAKADTLG